MNVGERVKVHTFLEIDRIEYPYFIGLIDDLSFFITHRLSVLVQLWCASLQHLSAFHKDCTFGLPFVKIKNQDAAVNSKVSSFRFFLDDFSHLSV